MKKQIIKKPEIVIVNSNKTDRKYYVIYKQLIKHLEEMTLCEHLGQQFTRRALRKWCKKNTVDKPEVEVASVSLWLDDHIDKWETITATLGVSTHRRIHNEQINRRHYAVHKFDTQLKHVRLDQNHIYFNEKMNHMKLRDKQRLVKALNKLIEDFEPRETWQRDDSVERRTKVAERLLKKWEGHK
jgi:hypothetical protein